MSQESANGSTALVEVKKDARLDAFAGLRDEVPVSASDVLMPSVLLMQAQSDLVEAEKVKSGSYVGSLEGNQLADRGESFEVIPFGFHKTWLSCKLVEGRQEFHSISHSPLPRTQFSGGDEFVNFETINYYILLPSEIAHGVYIPYLLRFKSTSYMAGRRMETFRAKLQEFGKPHCFSTYLIGSEQRENPKGKFWVSTVTSGRDTTENELKAVSHWNQLVKSGKVRVDESDLRGDGDLAGAPANDIPHPAATMSGPPPAADLVV